MNAMRQRHGFSMPELIVVIGIILVLMAMIFPAIARARQHARAVQCRSQLREIGQALAMYASANKGVLIPRDANPNPLFRRPWRQLLFGEPTPRIVVCPTGIDIGEVLSYQLNLWLTLNRIKLGDKLDGLTPSEVVVAGENKRGIPLEYSGPLTPPHVSYDRFRHGRAERSNYLFLDFHVNNREPVHREGTPDPWYVRPIR